MPLPEWIAQHERERPTRPIFIRRKTSANVRLHADYIEEIAGDDRASNPLRLALRSKVVALRTAHSKRSDTLQRAITLLPLNVVRSGHEFFVQTWPRNTDPHQSFRIGIRQRTQQDAIHNREDRGRNTNAQRE